MTFINDLWVGVFSASFVQQHSVYRAERGFPSSLQMNEFCTQASHVADEAVCAYRRMKADQSKRGVDQ